MSSITAAAVRGPSADADDGCGLIGALPAGCGR